MDEIKEGREIRIAKLYNRKDEDGNRYLLGKWDNDFWVKVYVNEDKKIDTDPDCYLDISPVNKSAQGKK